MESYKKAWFFMKHFKMRMLFLVLFMVLVQFFAMLSPYIISIIIDENIVGVTSYPWVEVVKEDSKTVTYDGNIYKQERHLDSNDEVIGDLTLIMDETNFYAVKGEVDFTDEDGKKVSHEIIGNEVHVNDQVYPADKLTTEEIQAFYQPLVNPLFIAIILLLLTLLFKSLFGYAQRMTGAMITVEATRMIRKEAMAKLQYIPIEFIESEPAGKTTNRILADSMGVSDLYITSLNIIFSSFVGIFFAYMFMFKLDAKLAAFCLLLIPIIIVWIRYFSKRINAIATKTNETNSKMIASINEIINGINILKIFNRDKETIDDFADLNTQFVDESMSEVKMHITTGWNGINLFQGIAGALVLFFFGYQNLQGNIIVEAGVIYAYYNYVIAIIAPIGHLFHSIGAIENSKVKVARLFLLLDQPLESKEITEGIKYSGDIRFENVSFSYNQEKYALRNINLDIKSGEKIGLVGHTGSGKSTMMNLLLRFNDLKGIDKGNIFIDNQDITSMTKRTYRQDIGIILQEPILFSGSVYDNICYSKTVSKEEAAQMLIRVGGQKLLDKLEEGIDTTISRRGGNLSLGEKQLISFARILVSNPSIIVMDEATANIDTETEEMINYGIAEVAQGRTLIVIAHRLSTIVNSNQIIVLNQGEIIEQGTHKDLLNFDGYYANMYRSQVS